MCELLCKHLYIMLNHNVLTLQDTIALWVVSNIKRYINIVYYYCILLCLGFQDNFKVRASELLENQEEMFFRYYMYNDVIRKSKSTTTHGCVTRRESTFLCFSSHLFTLRRPIYLKRVSEFDSSISRRKTNILSRELWLREVHLQFSWDSETDTTKLSNF